ncbi:hypothetical protein [Methanoculleus sp.]|uniref:hypothetical protein n=1 Tax=Methanoculleus sp. TaxID=90427 RepID=UPI002FCAC448
MIATLLLSCCTPALALGDPDDLSSRTNTSPIQSSVETRTFYPLAWHNAGTTWYLNESDLSYTIQNPTTEPVLVRLTSQYPGYSHPVNTTVRVEANSTLVHDQYIRLNLPQIREVGTTTTAAIYYRIEYQDGDTWIVEEEKTNPVTFYPMNQMVWAIEDPDGKITVYHGFIAAFVTPQSGGVMDLLAKAKEWARSDLDERYAKYGLERSLRGYSGNITSYSEAKECTALQVKAIYNALKYDYNLSYVHTPVAFGVGDMQRVNTPDESLERRNANCIEGAVLVASAIEALGMRPYIIITPDHAYVAWDTDSSGTQREALETTLINDYDFEAAKTRGNQILKEDSGRTVLYQSLFDMTISREDYNEMCVLVDITWLRSQKILPMA